MSTDNPIFLRKSSLNFNSDSLSKNEIESIVKASMWAPSSRNGQPWRIIGITKDSDNFKKIISCLSSGNQIWAKNSGLVLIFSTKKIEDEFNPKTFLDIGFSGQNAMIEATKLGLETHPIGGWDEESVKSVAKIPQESKVAFILIVGKPGKETEISEELLSSHKKTRERNAVSEHFNYDQWGEKF